MDDRNLSQKYKIFHGIYRIIYRIVGQYSQYSPFRSIADTIPQGLPLLLFSTCSRLSSLPRINIVFSARNFEPLHLYIQYKSALHKDNNSETLSSLFYRFFLYEFILHKKLYILYKSFLNVSNQLVFTFNYRYNRFTRLSICDEATVARHLHRVRIVVRQRQDFSR